MPGSRQRAPTAAVVQRRPVVTSFVQNDKGQVLLVQRSDKVSTYQHMWGGVSGGLEPGEDLLYRAKQELLEEVSITEGQLTLVAQGRPLQVDDEDKHFLVHPFLFKLTTPEGDEAVQLNWESEKYQWVEPSEILSLPTVPRLAATLQRVVLPPYMQHHVNQLLKDRSHGAAELARKVVVAFQAAECYECGQESGMTGEDQLELYYDFAYQLATCRPSMAAIANTVVEVLQHLDRELCARAEPFEPPAGHIRLALSNAADTVMRHLDRLQHDQLANGVAVLGHARKIMTLSYSSTILRCILQAAARDSGAKPHVVVLESRPLCEGVKLAQKLGEHGIPVTLITDAQAAAFMDGCDAVLVGADAVVEDGIINKVGTHLVALAAQSYGVPVYILADSMKISPGPVTAANIQNLASWSSTTSPPPNQPAPSLSLPSQPAPTISACDAQPSVSQPSSSSQTSSHPTSSSAAMPAQPSEPQPSSSSQTSSRTTSSSAAIPAQPSEPQPSSSSTAVTSHPITTSSASGTPAGTATVPADMPTPSITEEDRAAASTSPKSPHATKSPHSTISPMKSRDQDAVRRGCSEDTSCSTLSGTCGSFVLEEKDASELYPAWSKYKLSAAGVLVRNVYFELLPWSRVTAVISDKGVMSVDSIKASVEQLREQYSKVFKI